ncbi:MAG: tetratricopeptide repeat protein [Sphingobacteriales bacterium]|nr:tetratricopeptide repeat protein [Sphingobacteriales bacterium]
MPKCIFHILFWLLPCALIAQERGLIVTPYSGALQSPLKGDSGKRKAALLVGVADYSSPKLKLKYAGRDARLFFSYLTETRGFPKENVFILPDSAARSGKIYNSIIDLMKWLEPGDELVLYFAGHGDVQHVADFDEGFFLAWDASDSRNYFGAAGTVKLSDLEQYTNRLALNKKVKVTLVMDACHSGFSLHQDGFLKAQESISNSFGKVTRMLGCNAKEFSFEADSVGHGLFTWYLVQGLMGLADEPADNNVTAGELEQWVKNRVSAATHGKQNPVMQTPAGAEWSVNVSPETRNLALTLFRNKNYDGFLAGRGSGNPDTLDLSGYQQYVDRYNRFLQQEKLYGEDSSCLSVIKLLESLQGRTAAELRNGLRNHLAEVLETQSQLVLNEYLTGKSLLPPPSVYRKAGEEASIALSLLPDEDPRRKNISVMSAFHRAYASLRYEEYEKFGEAGQLLRDAIQTENRAAYLYLTLSYLLQHQHKYDSAIFYAQKAEALIPTWSHPKNVLGNLYHDIYQYEKSLDYHRSVLKLDSSYAWSYNNIGVSLLDMDRLSEAEYFFQRSLALKKTPGRITYDYDLARSYSNLAVIAMERKQFAAADSLFALADSLDPRFSFSLRKWSELSEETDGDKAEALLKKALATNPHEAENYYALAEFYRTKQASTRSRASIDSFYSEAILLNPYNESYYAGIGFHLLDENRYDSAYTWFRKGIDMSGGKAEAWSNMAWYYKFAGEMDKAIAALEKNLELNPWDIGSAENLSGFILQDKKDPKKAEQVLLRLLPLHPHSPRVHFLLGNFYYRTGNTAKAIAAYRQCLQTDSQYVPAAESLSLLLLRQGQIRESLEWAAVCRRFNPGFSLSYLHAAAAASIRMAPAAKTAWLRPFLQAFPGSDLLAELLAEAAYRSGSGMKDALQHAGITENKLDYRNSGLLRWLFLLAVEAGGPEQQEEYAGRYLEEVLVPEPALQALACWLTGNKEEAGQWKKEAGPGAAASYRTQFKKIWIAIR